MAPARQGWWKAARSTLAKLPDMARVVVDMVDGRCIKEFEKAMEQCDREQKRRRAMADRKPGEVISCAKATAALRKCMQGKAVLAKHLVALDKGIAEEERRRWDWDPYVKKVKPDTGYRWWTGMKMSEEE